MELKWRPVSELENCDNYRVMKALVIDYDGSIMIGRLFKDKNGYSCDSMDNFLTDIEYFIPIFDLLKTIPNE